MGLALHYHASFLVDEGIPGGVIGVDYWSLDSKVLGSISSGGTRSVAAISALLVVSVIELLTALGTSGQTTFRPCVVQCSNNHGLVTVGS